MLTRYCSFEATFGRTAYAHLFVTEAMHDHLVKEWCLRYAHMRHKYITNLRPYSGRKAVLHDRPPAHFHRAQTSEVHEVGATLRPNPHMLRARSALPPPRRRVENAGACGLLAAATSPLLDRANRGTPCARDTRSSRHDTVCAVRELGRARRRAGRAGHGRCATCAPWCAHVT
jgi:hypothetical protein